MASQTETVVTASAVDPSVQAETSQLDCHGYLFGKKLTNSWSPFLHSVIYEDLGLNWGQVRLDSDDIPLFLKLAQHPQFYGASVTMPNKVAIIPYLDQLTDECRDIGACNTVFFRTVTDPSSSSQPRRVLCGTNTDVIGIRDSFIHNVPEPQLTYHSKPALVIGGGGAARSAVYALRRWLQVTTIYLVNRDAAEVESVIRDCEARGYGENLLHVQNVDQVAQLDAPGAIVACVPDFAPQTAEEQRARDITEAFLDKGNGAMLEMCYNPTPFTQLAAVAEGKGWQVILGTEALIWQGLEQDRYWTGKAVSELPVKKVQEAIAEKVAQRSQSKL